LSQCLADAGKRAVLRGTAASNCKYCKSVAESFDGRTPESVDPTQGEGSGPNLLPDSCTPKRPLRIGLLLDTAVLPRWSAEVLEHIHECDFAAIKLIVYNSSASAFVGKVQVGKTPIRKLRDTLRDARLRRRLLFSLYQRWDLRNVDPQISPDIMVDCSEPLAHVASIQVNPIIKGFTHRFPDDAVARIREMDLDVLIRFGFNILRGAVLTAARYGIWSYHHGDNDYYRGGPAYFWEVVERNPISGAILQVLTEDLDAGKVLCKALFVTKPGLSHARNRVQPYWGASRFMIHKLRELHAFGWDHVERNAVKPAPYRGRKRIYSIPSNAEMLRWLLPVLMRKSWQRCIGR
jgi:hypothetical protein